MYIRTKDSIYEVVTAERGIDNKLLYIISTSKTENTTDWVHEADVISKADTIEELCDEFIGYFEIFNRSYYFIYKNSYDELKRDVQTIQYSAYGAIWTDKGLIYVAKMNDKGDFELI